MTADPAKPLVEARPGDRPAETGTLVGPRGGRPRTAAQATGTRGAIRRFVVQLARGLAADRIADAGAMMAYYAILALFPMLVFVLTIAMLVVDVATIEQGVAIVTQAMPPSTREVITARVQAFVDTASAGFAVGTAAFALWGAARGARALSGALNTMSGKAETRPWWRRQLLAIGVTLAVAIIMVLALALLVIGPIAGHWLADRLGLGAAFDRAWSVGRWLGAGLLVMLVWAMLYRLLPNTRAPFRTFLPGAFAGVLGWLGLSYGFGVYLGYAGGYETTYGALGGGIVFLVWLWLSNIALLFGAEVNDVLADLRRDRAAAARQVADAAEPGRAPVEPPPAPAP